MSFTVIGLGRSGLSTVRYLRRHDLQVIAADTRLHPPHLKIFKQKFPDVPLFLGVLPEKEMLGSTAVIVPPGLGLTDPIFKKLKNHNVPLWGDIELFAQSAKAPVLAITGSNGKSTVTSLVGAMAQASRSVLVGGNIGVPALDLLDINNEPDCYVLELSSFQLETTHSLKPKVAAILNITRDHLDRHGSLEAYTQAKQRIYLGAEWAVYNRHDVLTKPIIHVPNEITFGFDEPQDGHFGLRDKDGESWVAFGKTYCLPVSKIKLFGRHNLLNAMSALCMGTAAGFPMDSMLGVLQTFSDLKHRCQFVANKSQVQWINDSKGTNVGASVAAVESVGHTIKGKIVLLLGGKAKDKDFSDLIEPVSKFVKCTVLFGADGALVGKVLESRVPCYQVETLTEAVLKAQDLAEPQDAVLLSPACTSLDAFANFEERGESFIQAVHQLVKG